MAEDHPVGGLVVVVVGLGVVCFYLMPLRGMAHATNSFANWRLEAFGGERHLGRSIEIAGVLASLEPLPYDRIDIVSPAWAYMPGTAFRGELERVIRGRGGSVRLITLDPRLGEEGHRDHGEFEALAAAFGQESWEFSARLWYSAAVLVRLRQQYGDGFQIGFIGEPLRGSWGPYFSPARWAHAYVAADPDERLDIVAERVRGGEGKDSTSHPAVMVRDRPAHPLAAKYRELFDEAWAASVKLDAALEAELLGELERKDG